MKKNVLATKNEMVDGEINLGREKLISTNVHGHCRRENGLYKPPNCESLFPATVQYKNRFLAIDR